MRVKTAGQEPHRKVWTGCFLVDTGPGDNIYFPGSVQILRLPLPPHEVGRVQTHEVLGQKAALQSRDEEQGGRAVGGTGSDLPLATPTT